MLRSPVMRVVVVPCLQDNYAYLVHAEASREALVVDPSEAAPVLVRAAREGLRIVGILNTHHHWDHTGGNEDIVRRSSADLVYGHKSDAGRIPMLKIGLSDGESFEAAGLSFRVMHVPGHTSGALAYICDDTVFTGDTLFTAGCGRLFEGTAAQMYESLNLKLGSLPDSTRIFCGHEYTAANLRFAAHVEPGNAEVREKAETVAKTIAAGQPTVPSSVGDERRTNPFLRCESPEIIRGLGDKLRGEGPVAVLAALRAAKDAFS